MRINDLLQDQALTEATAMAEDDSDVQGHDPEPGSSVLTVTNGLIYYNSVDVSLAKSTSHSVPKPCTPWKYSTDASILLVGFRGVGKSTLALILAAHFQWLFIDCDRGAPGLSPRPYTTFVLILATLAFQKYTSCTPKQYVETHSWEAFRCVPVSWRHTDMLTMAIFPQRPRNFHLEAHPARTPHSRHCGVRGRCYRTS